VLFNWTPLQTNFTATNCNRQLWTGRLVAKECQRGKSLRLSFRAIGVGGCCSFVLRHKIRQHFCWRFRYSPVLRCSTGEIVPDVSTGHSALLFRVAQAKGLCLCRNSALNSPVLRSHVSCLSDDLCAAALRTDQQLRCTMQSASHCLSHVQPNISTVYTFVCSLLAGNDAVLYSSSFCKHVHMAKHIFFFSVPLLQYKLYPIVW
jgi:hypothetical protein